MERVFVGLLDRMGTNLERQDEVLGDATSGQRAICALWVADGEVNNGGFEQFFFNSSDSLMDEAIEGADLIGASANERILREAAAVFRDGNVREASEEATWRGYRDALGKSTRGALGALDDRWFARDEQFVLRMIAYVEANPGQFFR